MKQLLMIFGLLSGLAAHAVVLDVNNADKTVYYHPSPSLQVSLTDLGNDGGYLRIFVDYSDSAGASELVRLQQQYPGKTVQAVMASPDQSEGVFSIDQTDLRLPLPLRQGQIGPYVNVQTVISKDQMKQILAVKSQLQNLIHVSLPAHSSFEEATVVEQYMAPAQICNTLKIKSIRDLILGLNRMPKPAGIEYQQTFDSLKEQMLDHCYEISVRSINSFKDLLTAGVQTSPPAADLTAQYLEQRTSRKSYELNPQIKVNLN